VERLIAVMVLTPVVAPKGAPFNDAVGRRGYCDSGFGSRACK